MNLDTAPVHAPSVLLLAWRQLWRDLRAGELRMLGIALILAVAAVSAVSFLADRMERGLQRDAAQLLGGDALVVSDKPLASPIRALAHELGLRRMESANFVSMARSDVAQGANARLVAVKAVSADYPLRGRLLLSDGRRVGAPQRGEAWVDQAVLDALELKSGQLIGLGQSWFKLKGVIAVEPDRGAGFLNFAPRVMIAEEDLEATGLVRFGSRVTYRLAVATDDGPERISQFSQRVEALIAQQGLRGTRLESLENARPEMRQTLERAASFLRLVAMLAALLAAVAVSLAARDYAGRHLDSCAMLRVLGLSQRTIALTYSLAFACAGLLSSALGLALGFSLHYAFLGLLQGLLPVDLPPAGFGPVLGGLGLGLSLLMGFGLAPVLQLASVPPLRVIRRELGRVRMASLLVLGGGLLGFAGLLMLTAGDWRLGLISSAGFLLALLCFALMAWLGSYALRWLVPQAAAPRWLILATRQLAARPNLFVVQVSSLALGLLALMLLLMLRTDLFDSWRAATPPDAPNRFVINIQPEQAEPFRQALASAGIARYDWFPMIRGRLIAINEQPISPAQYKDDRARALVEREFNLSHSAELPEHNQILAGRWKAEEADGLSVEQGLAQQLGIKLGDRLRFDVAGEALEGRVSSLRKVDWTSMRVNFYVLLPREELAGLPHSFITAFRAPLRPRAFDKALAQQFPNVTAIDVSAQLAQLQLVLDQVAQAVQLLFMFSLLVGLIVLAAAVGGSRDARVREFALMRAMGASAALLAKVQRAELLGIGALAGLLAGGLAQVLGAALARFVFDFNWGFKPWLPLGGMLAGAALAQFAGWWVLRGVLNRPVSASLREADA